MLFSPNFSSTLTPQVWDDARANVAELVPRGARVLVAVSGGADSLALWQVLRACDCEVVVAHINHQARGIESDNDADFVAQICAEWNVRCRIARVQVLADGGQSFEMAARAVRYQKLENLACEENCDFLATGHTSDDQLETVLLHWLRGAAIEGLRGIEPIRVLSPQLKLVRPILGLTRKDTEAICVATNIHARHDASNDDPKYLRNRVRQEVVPLLAKLIDRSGAREQLARQTLRATQILRDDFALLDEIAQRELEKLMTKRESQLLVLDGLKWRDLPVSMQRRTLRLAAKTVLQENGLAGEISSRKIEVARVCILGGERRTVWMWTHDLRVEWTGAGSGNRIRLKCVKVRTPPQ